MSERKIIIRITTKNGKILTFTVKDFQIDVYGSFINFIDDKKNEKRWFPVDQCEISEVLK